MIDIKLPKLTIREGLYKDIMVLANVALEFEITHAVVKPVVISSDEKFDIKTAKDGWNGKEVTLEKDASLLSSELLGRVKISFQCIAEINHR